MTTAYQVKPRGAGDGTTRRHVLRAFAASAGMGAFGASACAPGVPGAGAPSQRPAELTGTFEFFVQNFAPTVAIHEQSIAGFKEVAPNAKLTMTTVPFNEMAAKATTVAAAGRVPTAYTPTATSGAPWTRPASSSPSLPT